MEESSNNRNFKTRKGYRKRENFLKEQNRKLQEENRKLTESNEELTKGNLQMDKELDQMGRDFRELKIMYAHAMMLLTKNFIIEITEL